LREKEEMTKTLKLVLTDHWFEEIKSGRKTHEYRLETPFWRKRIVRDGFFYNFDFVEFQKAYRKNAEKMTFKIKSISIHNGKNTDLRVDTDVFDIELGERVK